VWRIYSNPDPHGVTHLGVEIKGKRGGIVPVLFTKEMRKSVDILVRVGQEAGVTQPYMCISLSSLEVTQSLTEADRNQAQLQNPGALRQN
jgi:hypothetical protein